MVRLIRWLAVGAVCMTLAAPQWGCTDTSFKDSTVPQATELTAVNQIQYEMADGMDLDGIAHLTDDVFIFYSNSIHDAISEIFKLAIGKQPELQLTLEDQLITCLNWVKETGCYLIGTTDADSLSKYKLLCVSGDFKKMWELDVSDKVEHVFWHDDSYYVIQSFAPIGGMGLPTLKEILQCEDGSRYLSIVARFSEEGRLLGEERYNDFWIYCVAKEEDSGDILLGGGYYESTKKMTGVVRKYEEGTRFLAYHLWPNRF